MGLEIVTNMISSELPQRPGIGAMLRHSATPLYVRCEGLQKGWQEIVADPARAGSVVNSRGLFFTDRKRSGSGNPISSLSSGVVRAGGS